MHFKIINSCNVFEEKSEEFAKIKEAYSRLAD